MNTKKKKCKPLTGLERKRIEAYIKSGKSLSEAAELLNRGRNTVIAEVRRNGGRDAYEHSKAHEEAQRQLKEGKDKQRKIAIKNYCNPYIKISEQLANLQMQVDVLAETCKKLMRSKQNEDNKQNDIEDKRL
jgi:IS30 family transposase